MQHVQGGRHVQVSQAVTCAMMHCFALVTECVRLLFVSYFLRVWNKQWYLRDRALPVVLTFCTKLEDPGLSIVAQLPSSNTMI